MALQKSIELDNGVSVDYWKISQFTGFDNGLHTFQLSGYLNQATREADKLPVKSEQVTIAPEIGMAFREGTTNILTFFYNYLKSNDYRFVDSIDV